MGSLRRNGKLRWEKDSWSNSPRTNLGRHAQNRSFGSIVRVEYVRAYQYSLNAAVAVLSAEAASAKQSRTVGVGRTQIWPCFDGAFVAISRREDRKIIVEVNEQLSITMADLL